MPTTQTVEIVDKKEFAATALNEDDETFVVHIATTSVKTASNVYLSWQAQIMSLKVKEITIFLEYTDYTNIFSSDSATELSKHTGIKNHPINLVDDKQPPFGLIYNLKLVELEMLKTYIKANLANGFIWPFKSLADAPILFIYKKNGSFWLYVDY